MEFTLESLAENVGKEGLKRLETVLWALHDSYEPWADMMMLGGAGDGGVDHFPLNLDEIESIEVTAHRVVEPE
ncbi:MAG: hypothetical protein RBS57_00120 [Desulforhabdus sp.]|jgi:hypothetical protein|nr:hypothetical protein [Desulforhabdus sp.]